VTGEGRSRASLRFAPFVTNGNGRDHTSLQQVTGKMMRQNLYARNLNMNTHLLLFLLMGLFMVAVASGAETEANAPAAVAKPLITRALPDIEDKEVMMLTVEYPPGGASTPHRHDANTFVYVLEGAVVMKVEGGKEVTLKPGDTFYESPTDIHSVSRNASATEPAKFLVFFVKDQGKAPTTPVSSN
jgi:quercetin dioxygenase-like cupin family protein